MDEFSIETFLNISNQINQISYTKLGLAPEELTRFIDKFNEIGCTSFQLTPEEIQELWSKLITS